MTKKLNAQNIILDNKLQEMNFDFQNEKHLLISKYEKDLKDSRTKIKEQEKVILHLKAQNYNSKLKDLKELIDRLKEEIESSHEENEQLKKEMMLRNSKHLTIGLVNL